MLKEREHLINKRKKLAYSLILPTIILVLSIVIIPLLANFWISFKPISLGDLRPPKLILKESVRSKLSLQMILQKFNTDIEIVHQNMN